MYQAYIFFDSVSQALYHYAALPLIYLIMCLLSVSIRAGLCFVMFTALYPAHRTLCLTLNKYLKAMDNGK